MLSVNQNTDDELRLIIRDKAYNKEPVDLTNAVVYFFLKEFPYQKDSSVLIKKHSNGGGITIVSPEYGAVIVYFTIEDLNLVAGRYACDVYVLFPNGNYRNIGATVFMIFPSIPLGMEGF